MSDMNNFLGQAPAQVGLIGHLESSLAQKSAPSITAKFGGRLPGWSGVTLPGTGANTVGFPKPFRQMLRDQSRMHGGKMKGGGNGPREVGIGRPRPQNGMSYY